MKDADKYALNTAKEKDFQILQRSNDLRSLISTKKGEINELDKMVYIVFLFVCFLQIA